MDSTDIWGSLWTPLLLWCYDSLFLPVSSIPLKKKKKLAQRTRCVWISKNEFKKHYDINNSLSAASPRFISPLSLLAQSTLSKTAPQTPQRICSNVTHVILVYYSISLKCTSKYHFIQCLSRTQQLRPIILLVQNAHSPDGDIVSLYNRVAITYMCLQYF